MKYGIIADIHSNILALNKVLDKFREMEVDKIICCGDIIGIGPYSEKCVQELILIKDNLICVKGNHENYLIDGLPQKVHDDKRSLSISEINCHLWNQNQLSESSKYFLSSLQKEIYITDNNFEILITHYPTSIDGNYKRHIKAPTLSDCEELFKEHTANIYIYGHTHSKSMIKTKEKMYINPGSVGCPMDTNMANCGILSIDGTNSNYEDINIEYNVKNVIREIEELNYPMSTKIIDIFFGNRHFSK